MQPEATPTGADPDTTSAPSGLLSQTMGNRFFHPELLATYQLPVEHSHLLSLAQPAQRVPVGGPTQCIEHPEHLRSKQAAEAVCAGTVADQAITQAARRSQFSRLECLLAAGLYATRLPTHHVSSSLSPSCLPPISQIARVGGDLDAYMRGCMQCQ